MEWNSVKMSRGEFERMLKEYSSAAMRTAEKARAIEENKKVKSEIAIASIESNVEQQPIDHLSEDISIIENTDEVTADTEEAEAIISVDIADEPKNIPVAIPVDEETVTQCEQENENNQEQSSENGNMNYDEEFTEEGNNGDETEINTESVDDILDSFKSVFISEEEAEKKAEELCENKNISRAAPNFNSAIHNHNINVKSCGCQRCHSNYSTTHIQEKGGHKTG